MSPTISIVIPVHNGADTITEQLDSIRLAQQNAPASEVLVIDNRSTDDLARTIEEWSAPLSAEVRVIAANDKVGEPHARNVGLAHARGRFVAYCDADDRVGPFWLQGLCELLEERPYATGPIDMHSMNPNWLADVRGSSVTGCSKMLETAPYAHGCNMGFRRDVLLELGGFDERYYAGCDLDVAIRFWEAGHDLGYDERAVVSYRLRPTLRSTYLQGVSYGRYRVAIHSRLADLGLSIPKRRTARILWLARNVPAALAQRRVRAKWMWTAGQFVGERLGSNDQQIVDLTVADGHSGGNPR